MSDWIGILEGVVDQFGLLSEPRMTPTRIRSVRSLPHLDRKAWELLKDALAAEVQLDTWLGSSPETLDVNQLLDRVQEILSLEKLPHDHDQRGPRARAFSAKHSSAPRAVSVCRRHVGKGISAGGARRSDLQRSRVPAIERRRIAVHRPPATRAEEMLLFYEVVTRPTRRLVLTYPALDEAAQPLLPSPYLLELQQAWAWKRSRIFRSVRCRSMSIRSPTERRVKAMAEMLAGKPQRMADLSRPTVVETWQPGTTAAHFG